MMGERQVQQDALFYEFSLERHVPEKHLLRAIDRFVELDGVRAHLAPFYSETGRPSIDPELLIRMLIVGYCFGIRSERRLCEEVRLNLAYRGFCRLGLDGSVPDHSTFSKNRHGRFRESDVLRRLFETVLHRCIDAGLVGGEGFAVDACLIQADASNRNRVEGAAGLPPTAAGRAVEGISRHPRGCGIRRGKRGYAEVHCVDRSGNAVDCGAPRSTPPTSQLDRLISMMAMIVLFWSRATRDLLKSFGGGIGALHRLNAATRLPFPRRQPHSISRFP
jgi:transposase